MHLEFGKAERQTLLSLDVGELRVRALRRLPGPALPALVGLDVFGEVVTPHEPLAALLAAETFLAGVGAQVPLQLVGAREAFAAEEPVTDEGSLAGMPAQVRLEVRRLLVHFAALGNVADVQSLLSKLQAAAAAAAGLAVGALAAPAAARGAEQTLGGPLEESGDLRLVAQHELSAKGKGMVGGCAVGLGKAPPLLPFLTVASRQLMPG